MVRFTARTHLMKDSKGNLIQRAFSGMRPSLNVNNKLITCSIVINEETIDKLNAGLEQEIIIELPWGEEYTEPIRSGINFHLNVGAVIIGSGEIIKVL